MGSSSPAWSRGGWTEATYGPGQRFDLMTVELVLDMDTLYAGTGRIIGGPTPGIEAASAARE
jgi:hypothetical protein